jgi:hypothetical protein
MTAVSRGDIADLVTSTGRLAPRDYADVGAQVSGRIEKLFVGVGDRVKEGDKLASIDAETFRERMQQSETSVAISKNNLETERENLKKAERDYLRQKAISETAATTRETVPGIPFPLRWRVFHVQSFHRAILPSTKQCDPVLLSLRAIVRCTPRPESLRDSRRGLPIWVRRQPRLVDGWGLANHADYGSCQS